jgi:hypothetical protein
MTDTFDLGTIQPSDEARERNAQRPVPTHGTPNECAVCARPINEDAKTTKWVECVGGGMSAWSREAPEADRQDGGYMGCHPVGPTCARKIPRRFLLDGALGAA